MAEGTPLPSDRTQTQPADGGRIINLQQGQLSPIQTVDRDLQEFHEQQWLNRAQGDRRPAGKPQGS